MIHKAHLEWELGRGWTVRCSCGWDSGPMGAAAGDAWTTKERGLEDVGHAAYARQRELDEARRA